MLTARGQHAEERWTDSAIRALTALCDDLGLRVRADERLARHTSMGVGGPCPRMIWPETPDHVRALCRWMGERDLRWRMIGGGTNLLISDAGVAEPVLHFGRLAEGLQLHDDLAHLPAGTTTARALRRTAEAGRDGLVWAAGLPGTIGGAAAGNAGCWGGEMADAVAYLDIVDTHGNAHRVAAESLRWAYRRLSLPSPHAPGSAIVAVGVTLTAAEPEALQARYEELQALKRERQPVGARNSGCIFRNPDGSSAGMLLDRAGCKGMRAGDAEISGVHANFIVNHGAATASDVLALIDRVRARVLEHFDVDLRPEICRW